MQFNDIEQIKKEFGVNAASLDEVRKQLKRLLKEVHPDMNHGKFPSQEQEKKYHEIKDAINFIDEQRSTDTSLMIRSEVQELLQLIREVVPKTSQVDSEKKLSELIDNDIKLFKIKHKFPKITTAAISVVLSALWLFPNTIKEHPILSRLIDLQSPIFAGFWLSSLIVTASYWLIAAFQEHREEQSKKYLKLETVQNQIFRDFLRFKNHGQKNDAANNILKFDKDDLISYIKNFERIENPIYGISEKLTTALERNVKLHYRAGHIDTELAQSLADTMVQRGLVKGIIEKESKKSLTDIYLVKIDNADLD